MLADILPRIAAETQEQRGPYKPRPSLAGPERCIRQLTYMALGTPPAPFPGRTVLVFDDGGWHEQLTADWIRKSAYQLHSEQMAVSTPVGVGHIDGIITDLAGVDRLYEHKSINHFGYERYWKGAYPLDYFTQIALYIVGLHEFQPNINEALLLLKNKNTSAYMEFLLAYDRPTDLLTVKEIVRSDGERHAPAFVVERIVQSAVEKFALVESYRAKNTLPARPYEYGTDFPCNYCPFAKTCWSGYAGEFKALAEEKALDEEVEQTAAYYLETSMHLREMKKEHEGLRDKLKLLLVDSGVKSGKAGPYVLKVSMVDKWSLNDELIPLDVLERARVNTPYLKLSVTKPEAKEAKDGNGSD